MVVVVDHHHRRRVAGAEALEVDVGAAAVGGDLVLADAELLVQRLHDLVGAAELAGEVGADADAVAAHRLLVEEVVEGDDAVDLGRRQVELGGDRLDRLVGQPAAPARAARCGGRAAAPPRSVG